MPQIAVTFLKGYINALEISFTRIINALIHPLVIGPY